MCGIAAYLGHRDADQLLLGALERLKYRGYDSAGIAIVDDGAIRVAKAAGKLPYLAARISSAPLKGRCGIAHTRWATHGAPTEVNSHPHLSDDGRVAVVHNGIIENHAELRRALELLGRGFRSQTDTEVIPQLIAELDAGDPVAAVRAACSRLTGQFAFAAVFAAYPGRIIAARRGSPLIVGRGDDGLMLASDAPALVPHAREALHLGDGCIAELDGRGVRVTTFAGEEVEARFRPLDIAPSSLDRGAHDSFMAKEIAEQPEALARLIDSRLRGGRLVDPDLGVDLAAVERVLLLGCGTSWHAAMNGKRLIEQLARVPVEVDVASEWRHRDAPTPKRTLVLAISQSGETADTLSAIRAERAKGASLIALVNAMGSTIARESDGAMPLMAGPEIGVASTKAYTAQLMALYLFALQLARCRREMDEPAIAGAVANARAIVHQAARTLVECEDAVVAAADTFAAAEATVFLGRGGEHATALEGALKLKELAYVHAVGHPAGEFKHGPIAVVTDRLPVIGICPRDGLYDKTLSNLHEARARAGRIIAVGHDGDAALAEVADVLLPVRSAPTPALQPLLSILPLQRYAYHVARRRGCDVDQPRNLAKSVTVE